MDVFEQHVNETLALIGQEKLSYYKEEAPIFQKAYDYVKEYAYQKKLTNTAIALRVVRALHSGTYRWQCCKKPLCLSLSCGCADDHQLTYSLKP